MDIEIIAKETKCNIKQITEDRDKIILWRNDVDFIEYQKEDIVSLKIN